MKWHESEKMQDEIQSLSPDLATVCTQYLQRAQEVEVVHCECKNGHCLDLSYWWAIQKIIKMHRHNHHLSLGQIIRWFETMYNTCRVMRGYSLQFHSEETDDRIEEIHQKILFTLQDVMREAKAA